MKVKHMTTAKLKEILDSPYQCTNIGTDYGPYIEEVKAVYYERITRQLEEKHKRELKEIEKYERGA